MKKGSTLSVEHKRKLSEAQRNEKGNNWQGGSRNYRTLHQWVTKNLGTPLKCSKCKTTKKRVYHWANISGTYKRDLKDWVRLCVPCHYRFDGRFKDRCKRGHLLSGKNLYRWGSYRFCRTCRSDYKKKHK